MRCTARLCTCWVALLWLSPLLGIDVHHIYASGTHQHVHTVSIPEHTPRHHTPCPTAFLPAELTQHAHTVSQTPCESFFQHFSESALQPMARKSQVCAPVDHSDSNTQFIHNCFAAINAAELLLFRLPPPTNQTFAIHVRPQGNHTPRAPPA